MHIIPLYVALVVCVVALAVVLMVFESWLFASFDIHHAWTPREIVILFLADLIIVILLGSRITSRPDGPDQG